MRLIAALTIPLVLAGCATPREQCLTDVSRDLQINERLIAQTERTLERGFATRREQRVREVTRTCRGVTETGEAVRTRCPDVVVRNVQVPVAVDLNAERAKLASLQTRNAQLRARTHQAQDRCVALYPE